MNHLPLIKNTVIVCFISVLLTACASVAPPADNQHLSVAARQSALTSLKAWQLTGKIAFRSNQDAGTVNVTWQEQPNHYTLTLLAPLGAGGMTLTGNDQGITLKTDDGKIMQAKNAGELLRDHGGPNLPIQNLRYWIRGLPAPYSAANPRFDAYGRLSTLAQDGWQVEYLSYTHALACDLPSRLTLTSPDLKIKMMVYQWE